MGKSIFEKFVVKCISKVGTKKMCVEKRSNYVCEYS